MEADIEDEAVGLGSRVYLPAVFRKHFEASSFAKTPAQRVRVQDVK